MNPNVDFKHFDLKSIDFETIDFEDISLMPGMIGPVLSPPRDQWVGASVLYAGVVGSGESAVVRLGERFVGADIRRCEIGDDPGASIDSTVDRTFDYIAAPSLLLPGPDLTRLLGKLTNCLKPGGVLCAGVYGYAGYYGVNMVATIVRHLTADLDTLGSARDFAKYRVVTAAVAAQLPADHPARSRVGLMRRLRDGEDGALRFLLSLGGDRLYTVTRLMDCVTASGARFLRWLDPNLYQFRQAPSELPAPRRWRAAELVNGAPPEHWFFLQKS